MSAFRPGLLPSLLAMTAVGHQIRVLLSNPQPKHAWVLGGVIILSGVVLWAIRRLVRARLAAGTIN